MPHEITTIPLDLPFRMGTVNCYLVDTGTGTILIDTGSSHARAGLEKALAGAGCRPGDLQLIILTHGDFDHTGNGAYLRETYGARIAMHRGDVGMAERGDMFYNRMSANVVMKLLAPLLPLLSGFPRSSRFTPDLFLEEGTDLSEYGFDARVLSLPGHSMGSIGILTAGGDLFCGDLLENNDGPAFSSIMDDPPAGWASVEKLKSFEIHTVYPGHGAPFPMAQFLGSE
jgi:hydroxyacylglutathione hydrolase